MTDHDQDKLKAAAIGILGAPLGSMVTSIRVERANPEDQKQFDGCLTVGDKISFTFGEPDPVSERIFTVTSTE